MAEIMDRDMNTSNFASKGLGNAGLSLGIIGTALSVLSGGINGLGLGNNSNNGNGYVTQDEASKSAEIAALNSKIAILEADKATDAKLVDVYSTVNARTLDLERDLCKFKGDTAVALAQISSNIAVNSSNISCIQNTLNSLTKVVIPSTNVCTQSSTSTT